MAEYGFLPEDKTFATRAITTRFNPKQWDSWCVVTPIVLSTTFLQSGPNEPLKYIYGRSGNPTREVLQDILAALENAKYGLCFSTGLGCVSVISLMLKAGDHLIATGDVYGGVYRLFNEVLPLSGIEVDFVDLDDVNVIHKLVKSNTKMLWFETPTNPMVTYIDIEEACKAAHKHNLTVVVDNTFLTPYFQKPLALGADIVMHSLTKYCNGHSDVLMGAAVTNDEAIYNKLKYLQNASGIVPSPFDCYLVIRSLKSLKVRMDEHMKSSLKIAQFLEKHPLVEKVLHPALKSHPGHEIAKKQSSGWGGMIAFYLKGGLKESKTLLTNLKIFSLAESLGGFESLIEVPSVMTHACLPAEEKQRMGITDNMIRVSVGLENADDLIDDLKNAFEHLVNSPN